MEFASLIAEFGARYGMADLTPDENGAVGFVVDGRTVAIRHWPESGCVVASIEIAEPGAGAEPMNRLLMRANQTLFVLDGMAIVFDSGRERYLLLSRFDADALDFVGFDAKIAQLLDRADQWGSFFEKFRAFAEESKAWDDDLPPPDVVSGIDFMRV
ncbi:MAG: type III secretion system chaperone [Kiritimatiellae bacterium]|nr:type III secretion system chaperone [Kiritimatiellia bacterium]